MHFVSNKSQGCINFAGQNADHRTHVCDTKRVLHTSITFLPSHKLRVSFREGQDSAQILIISDNHKGFWLWAWLVHHKQKEDTNPYCSEAEKNFCAYLGLPRYTCSSFHILEKSHPKDARDSWHHKQIWPWRLSQTGPSSVRQSLLLLAPPNNLGNTRAYIAGSRNILRELLAPGVA